MSSALPGGHYCKAHQGNTSHYAEENCVVCLLQAEIERLQKALDVEKGWVSKYRDAHCKQVAEIEQLKKWQREMVEKAAAKSLDGYRELGAKCAALEKERDEARAEVKALKQGGHDEPDHEEVS